MARYRQVRASVGRRPDVTALRTLEHIGLGDSVCQFGRRSSSAESGRLSCPNAGRGGSSPVRTLRTMGNGGQSGWSWTRALHRLRGRRASVPEEALIIKAARLAVATRLASRTLFVRHLEVSDEEADQLLARLEHCGVIASEEPGRTRSVLTTPGELPDVIAEFTRRS